MCSKKYPFILRIVYLKKCATPILLKIIHNKHIVKFKYSQNDKMSLKNLSDMAALELVLLTQRVTSGDNSLAITLTPLLTGSVYSSKQLFLRSFFQTCLEVSFIKST